MVKESLMQKQQVICPKCIHCFTINDRTNVNPLKRWMDEDICNLTQKSMMLYVRRIPGKMGYDLPQYNDGIEHFTNLPLELKIYILSFVDEKDYRNAKKVCNEWRNLFNYLECNAFDSIPFPDRKWIQLQEHEQCRLLDDELEEYMHINPLAKYMDNIKL